MDGHKLPFKVGQLVEARSFLSGYRGAWFRCKIKEVCCKNGEIGHSLEYFDFPDEKIRWTKLYQKLPTGGRKSKEMKRQLMLRPFFPPVYRESQMPDVLTISDVVVIVNDIWKVGDLVDWWTDGCYWSGRVTDILGAEKVQIELPPPPMGEGSTYQVFCKDLRPSLDWSLNDGWRVPFTMEGKDCHYCAWLIQPVNQVVAGGSSNLTVDAMAEGRKEVHATTRASVEYNLSYSSRLSASSSPPPDRAEQPAKQPLSTTALKETHNPATNVDFELVESGIGKTSYSDSVSSSHVRDAPAEVAGTDESSRSLKKMKTNESISLNCMHSDTIESAILDLEELVNRVKWIKGILEFGMPLSNTVRPSWKFLEHRASSTPK